ncbi:competence protein ComEA [Orbus hercynius]|uniref:Competence protein ComEA n=1 Tax=Orbus hercynius TaxID=593135 RepID=A0A495RBV5_9GAMM|nr:helix-hairpin-helix domain-containing protein [Orbus hercynius]RKS84740.1 competence protein ComEA [Orbus hercynius]
MNNRQQYLMITLLFFFSLLSSVSIYAESRMPEPLVNKQDHVIQQVNINQASAEEMAKHLQGIGLNKAKKIVEYREKFGPFISIEQLKEVSGIGASIMNQNAGKLVL